MELDRDSIRRIMIAVNEISGACALMSKKIGIKENTLVLLYALDDGRPHSQKEICEQWFLPKTTLNTIVRECQEAGYLTLEEISGSREKTLRLTQSGRSLTARVLSRVYAMERQAAAPCGLTEEAVDALLAFGQNLKKEAKNVTYGT